MVTWPRHNLTLHKLLTMSTLCIRDGMCSLRGARGTFTYNSGLFSYLKRAGISQSVKRLATGWTVQGSNPGRGEIFRARPDQRWGPPSPLNNGYRVFPAGKTAGAWRWPPTPSSAGVKERVELYLYSTSGPSWPVIGRPLPLPSYLEV